MYTAAKSMQKNEHSLPLFFGDWQQSRGDPVKELVLCIISVTQQVTQQVTPVLSPAHYSYQCYVFLLAYQKNFRSKTLISSLLRWELALKVMYMSLK